jgi:hypothetical protein
MGQEQEEGKVTVTSSLEEMIFGKEYVEEKLKKEEPFEKEVRYLTYQTPVTADLARQLFKEGCMSSRQLKEINELIFIANLAFDKKSLVKATKMVNDIMDKCLEKKRRKA